MKVKTEPSKFLEVRKIQVSTSLCLFDLTVEENEARMAIDKDNLSFRLESGIFRGFPTLRKFALLLVGSRFVLRLCSPALAQLATLLVCCPSREQTGRVMIPHRHSPWSKYC